MVEYAGEKMSKSLGNLVLVRDALRHHRADAIRLYLHAHHYRTPFPYEDDGRPSTSRWRDGSSRRWRWRPDMASASTSPR